MQRKIQAAQLARTLTKRDVEDLMNNYDDNPQQALVQALRIVTGMPNASWRSLVAQVSPDLEHREFLYGADQSSLDKLAQHLNEQRSI